MLNANTTIAQATVCSQNGAEKEKKSGMNTYELCEVEKDEGGERREEKKNNKIPNRKKTGKQ